MDRRTAVRATATVFETCRMFLLISAGLFSGVAAFGRTLAGAALEGVFIMLRTTVDGVLLMAVEGVATRLRAFRVGV